MAVRNTETLLRVVTQYVKDAFPLMIDKKCPFVYMLMSRTPTFLKDSNTNNVSVPLSLQAGANPFTAVDSTVSAQTTARPYYNSVPEFARYIFAQYECPMVITREQSQAWDRAAGNNAARGLILDTMTEELKSYYARLIIDSFGGSAGATNQSKTSLMSLNFMCDNTQTIGGINPATGIAARNVANFQLNNRNLDREIMFMEEQRAVDVDFILVSTNSAGNDNLGKMRSWLTQSTMLTSSDKNLGQEEFHILGRKVYSIYSGAADKIWLGNSKAINIGMPGTPDETMEYIIPGTAAEAKTLFLFGGIFPGSVYKLCQLNGVA